MILVIDKKETLLRYSSGSIRIEQPGEKLRRAPINQLEQVIVYGNPLVETSVWRALSAAEIPTLMLSARGAGEAAMLGSGLAAQLKLRRMQHRIADDQQGQIALASWFVEQKLRSYELALYVLNLEFDVVETDCAEFRLQRDQTIEKLKQANTVATIMGLEGSIAHAWFALLARHLPYKWKFSGRNRQPPRDPVNALLSLGYTLMHGELRQLLLSSGFDPALGFLHQQYPGREALVLDFAELFRAAVDGFVLQLVTAGDLTPESFYYREAEGCRLNKDSRSIFFKAWAQCRHYWPRAIVDIDNQQQWPTTPFAEQVRGQVAVLRAYLQSLEAANG